MPAIAFKDETEWLALREHHIGGSEVSALFYAWRLKDGTQQITHLYEPAPADAVPLGCLSPYTTGYRLFLNKSGQLAPDDVEGERIDAGHFLEPALAEWAAKKFEMKLRKTRRYLTHEIVPGWGASLDYELVQPTYPPVEFKNVDGMIFRRDWISDGDEIATPPLHINLQLQAQIGMGAADHGWIVCCVGGNELKRGRIERHEPTQARIAEAITAFWMGVHAMKEPAEYADYRAVADHLAYGDKAQTTPLDLSLDADIDALCRRYLRWKQHADFTEKVVENLKGRIGAKLGLSPKGLSAEHRLTWPVIERTAKTIPARFQEAKTYRGGLTIAARFKE